MLDDPASDPLNPRARPHVQVLEVRRPASGAYLTVGQIAVVVGGMAERSALSLVRRVVSLVLACGSDRWRDVWRGLASGVRGGGEGGGGVVYEAFVL